MSAKNNKSVLITGVLGGIGLETARKYHRKGWFVIGIDNRGDSDPSLINNTVIDQYCQIDLSNQDEIISKVEKILNHSDHTATHKLTTVVHTAALQVNSSLNDTTTDQWDRVMNVNLKSIWIISQLVHPFLKRNHGSLIIINSIHAFASSVNVGAYAISKAALLGLVRNLAIEWGPDQIRVNGIAPGAIETPMLMDGLGRRGNDPVVELNILKKRHIMGSIGSPSDIADLIYFTGKSKFMTGETIIIDGGVSQILSTESKN
jgi:NAD(P)-dependent dehydrogenase (short-subunit alcohol dehydrogenase family)